MGIGSQTLAGLALVVFGLAGLVLVVAVAARMLRLGRAAAPPPLRPVPAAAKARAREEIARGRKIQAVEAIREATGYDLRTAKAAVDALDAGRPLPADPAPGALAPRVRELRDDRRMVEAIRLVTEQTGMNETEAARFIEALE